jgi:hypothetical protein
MTSSIGAVGGDASLAWINAANIVSLLAPKQADIFATLSALPPAPAAGASPSFAGMEGVFAIINHFQREITNPEIRPEEELIEDDLFTMTYLQYPNATIRDFVFTVVERRDSDDVKASKIVSWVVENIVYKTDEEVWGRAEMWQPPAVTLQRRSGDCEDGAFLVHSMMLNAGIPWERIRTYGGMVQVGPGAETGGHAWTAYQRESDDEWVILDTAYYPSTYAVEYRKPMRLLGAYYRDTLFYMTARYSVLTEGQDRILNPGIYTAAGRLAERALFPTAMLLRAYA